MDRYHFRSPAIISTVLMALMAPGVVLAQPSFTKSFAPDMVGPGNISRLTYVISNGGTTVTDLQFTETLPSGMLISNPSRIQSDCTLAILSAPEGGNTLLMIDARLGGDSQCQVSLDVDAAMAGGYTSLSGDLTSSAGNSGPSVADLIVDSSLPSFRKSFDPGNIQLGQVSTLTYVIDNTASPSNNPVSFSEAFPDHVVVAPLPMYEASASCYATSLAPQSGSRALSFMGTILAGQVCTVQVDVLATSPGVFPFPCALLDDGVDVGRATAEFSVVVPPFAKRFIYNPIAPGMTTLLEFSLHNFQRSSSLSEIAFFDDLEAMLPGTRALDLPLSDVCGPGSNLDGSSILIFSGGQLPAEESCTFQVEIELPLDASTGTYANETSPVSFTTAGEGGSWGPARAEMRVMPLVQFEMDISQEIVIDGDSLRMDFQLTNASAETITDITFTIPLHESIFGISSYPADQTGVCGAGSAVTHTYDSFRGSLVLSFLGGTLPAGSVCSFSVTYTDLPALNSGVYSVETSFLQATVNGILTSSSPVSDTFTYIRAPKLNVEFVDQPHLPGEQVQLDFTLRADESDPLGFSAITFSGDLGLTLAGLQAVGLPLDDICGPGSRLDGTSLLAFAGGSLAPGASCAFSVMVQIPTQAGVGPYSFSTSAVIATTQGVTVTGPSATAELEILTMLFEKSFVDNPVSPGGVTTLRYSITNHTPTTPASGMVFTEDLNATYAGIVLDGALPLTPCGPESVFFSAGATIIFTGGSLAPASSCSFDVPLRIPASAETGTYNSSSSAVAVTLGSAPHAFGPMRDQLHIADPLLVTKTFVDGPAVAGTVVQLEFLLANADDTHAATDLHFDDDLDQALPGTVALGLPLSGICGPGALMTGSSFLTFEGGSLAPGSTCSFTVPLQLPTEISSLNEVTNITSPLVGTLNGLELVSSPAVAELELNHFNFSHEFLAPGNNRSATVRFTIQNIGTTHSVPDLSFSLDLDAVLAGLVAISLPSDGMCGSDAIMIGESLIQFGRGLVNPGQTCSFDVVVGIPSSAAIGVYPSTTSVLMANDMRVAAASVSALTVSEEPDSDGDGVVDSADLDPADPAVCRDSDHDSCDDCALTGADGSGGDPANDGDDADLDGICDAGEEQGDQDFMGDSDLFGDTDATGDPALAGDEALTGDDQVASSAGDSDATGTPDDGCSCRSSGSSGNVLWLLFFVWWGFRNQRRRRFRLRR